MDLLPRPQRVTDFFPKKPLPGKFLCTLYILTPSIYEVSSILPTLQMGLSDREIELFAKATHWELSGLKVEPRTSNRRACVPNHYSTAIPGAGT